MMSVTQGAAVQDVKQLTDTHITVLPTECAALQTSQSEGACISPHHEKD